MALSGKMVGRITKTTASSTHTANAIRAHTNGGFSARSFGTRRSTASINDRTIARYGNSMVAQRSRNHRPRALTAQELQTAHEIKNNNDGRNMSYSRAAEEARNLGHQLVNANADRGGFRDRMTTSGTRFEAGRVASGRFGQTTNVNGSSRPMLSGAANAVARPTPTPNFRRPT